jgi:hypothetical protein
MKIRSRVIAGTAISALVAVAALSTFGVFGKSSPSALVGGSPYPLAQLLAYHSPKVLSDDIEAKISNAVKSLPNFKSERRSLDASGTSVTINGQSVTNAMIAFSEEACQQDAIATAAQNAAAAGLNVTTAINEVIASPYCEDQGVAQQVLRTTVIAAAAAKGTSATTAQAEAFAQQQYQAALSAVGTPNAITPPTGESLQDMFLCDSCIVGYQADVTFEAELSSIANNATAASQGHAAIISWLNSRLTTADFGLVGVPGVTASNLSSFLPDQLGAGPNSDS